MIAGADTAKIVQGDWIWVEYPPCLICSKPTEFTAVTLGYGSKFDMGVICPECCARYIDPAIEKAHEDHLKGNPSCAE